jgi:drug/metabolite transporter (DMT)-like permease
VVFTLILIAALLHASWNVLVKRAPDKELITVAVTTGAMAVAVVMLPFLPAPARASWPCLAMSGVLQVGYFVLLARAHSRAEMSQAYPLMRGSEDPDAGTSNAVVIAAYTLCGSVLAGPPLLLWAWLRGRDAAMRAVVGYLPLGLLGGAATVLSYALALWAMTRARVALSPPCVRPRSCSGWPCRGSRCPSA